MLMRLANWVSLLTASFHCFSALVRARANAHLGPDACGPMTLDNVQALPPGTMLGDYRLDAVIGHGGFGITYRAFDSQLAKVVAIKEYLPVEFAVREGHEGRAARRALRRRFRLGPRALPRRGARAGPLPPSAHRAGACASSRPTARPTPSWSSRTASNVAELLREPGRRLPPDEVRRLADGLLRRAGARCMRRASCIATSSRRNIIIRRDGVPDADRFRRGAAGDGRAARAP